MSDRGPLYDQGETPEDVATLYSWANLHGAKYRDFSEARAQTRERARLRVQQAMEEEQVRAHQQAQADRTMEAQRAAESALIEEENRQPEWAAQQTAEAVAQEAVRQAAQRANEMGREIGREPSQSSPRAAWQHPLAERFAAFVDAEPQQPAPSTLPPQTRRQDWPADSADANGWSFEPKQHEAPRREEFIRDAPQDLPEPLTARGNETVFEPAKEPAIENEPARTAHREGWQHPLADRFAEFVAPESEPEPQKTAPEPPAHDWLAYAASAKQWLTNQVPETLRQQDPVPQPELEAYVRVPEPVQEPARIVLPTEWAQPAAERPEAIAAPAPEPQEAEKLPLQQNPQDVPAYTADTIQQPVTAKPEEGPMREDSSIPPRSPWSQVDSRESANRPAWLTPERSEPAPQPVHTAPPVHTGQPVYGAQPPAGAVHSSAGQPAATGQTAFAAQPPAASHSSRPAGDTLQGSREQLASRWYALRGVFEGGSTAPVETAPAAPAAPAPVVAVFSLAGGVGKTSVVATLGRALSARGERVLLVDTAAYGLMPFFFGAHDQRPGMLRTFSPPGTVGDAPIQMITLDPETLGPETAVQEALTAEIGKYSQGVSRVIVDLATASGATSRRVMKMAPLVLVPMMPDMNSVVSISSIDSFFQHNQNGTSVGKTVLPYYVLNQFDPSLPLHLDIREVLREQLGDRLLPFALRRNAAVGEALAEGMTVMDYAPNSNVAEDFGTLAGWVKSQSAPASRTYRGVRWSER
jgi:cellulose synthase operon protein YhjQ